MKLTTLFACFFLCVFSADCQDVWSAISTSDATAESMDIVMDNDGNSYITGYISGDTEFGNFQIDITNGYSDMIVAKIDPEGNYLWVKHYSGPLSDKGAKIALASNNDLIVTGTFYNTITFSSTTLTAPNGSKDIFLVRLTNDGDVIWARRDGGGMGENVYGLTLDQQGNIILTGQFEGTSTIGTQTFTSTTDPDTNLPSFDMFFAKYDSNGNPLWAKASYAEYEDRGLAVVCDDQNNIYLTGQFSDTINYFGQTIYNQIYNAGFVGKFDPNGNIIWFDKLAAAQVMAYDLVLNHENQLIVTGDYLGQLVVWAQENQHVLSNPYEKKIFVLKISPNGNYIWGLAKGSESEVSSRTICVDEQDNIYIGGHFKCNFDEFRDSTGTAFWQSAGFRDQFVAKFTTSGDMIWKNQVGGQREDQCWGIAVKEADYPIISGSFATNILFPFEWTYDAWSLVSNHPLTEYDEDNINDVIFLILEGDESINIHVSKMVNNHSTHYNYYEYSPGPDFNDSVPMDFYPGDSAEFCPDEKAHVNRNTNYRAGPLYSGQWSNGQSWYLDLNVNNVDGEYSVNVQRLDGCYNYDDTIYIDYHPNPALPLLTDDHGVNNSTQLYSSISACYPDTLNFHFENLCNECSAEIVFNPFLPIAESLVMDSNYQTSVDSYIHIKVTNDYGCFKARSFSYSLLKDIKPYLILDDPYDYNDSIMICEGESVGVVIADSLTNPSGLLNSHEEIPSAYSVSVYNQGQLLPGSTTDGYRSSFHPTVTGWYVVNQLLSVGYTSCLYPHQISDSFYVEIKHNGPGVSILGGGLLCPDTYNFLTVSPFIPDLNWSGPGILWTSTNNDSIKLNESGHYTVSGNYNYGEVSCPFGSFINIEEKQAPHILMDPVDGIVCPDDSVLLYLDRNGVSYEWIGPEGDLVSPDSATYVTDQGFYACIFTDEDGCRLLTPMAEVREYSTPFIELSPVGFMCDSEPITLTAIYGGMVNIHWIPPLNSSSESVTVNQPGIYSCQISQCGITVQDSVTIIDASYELEITSESTIMCIGDTLLIQATPGLAVYQWSNGFVGLSFEATGPGTYSVQSWNNYGCTRFSDSITITAFPESYPPAINDTFVCQGGNIDLVYHSPFGFGWYTNPSDVIPFSTQDTISFTTLLTDTIVYIAHNSVNCPLNFTGVLVETLLPLTPPQIFGDTTICEGESASFEVDAITNGTYYWVYDGDTISTEASVSVPDITANSPLVFHIAMMDGCTDTENDISFSVKFASPISLDITSDTLCFGEALSVQASGSGNQQFYWTDGFSSWTGANLDVGYFDLYSNHLTVYGVNTDDCRSETLSVDVTKSPDADLQLSMDTISCLGNALTLSAVDNLGPITWILPSGSSQEGPEFFLESVQKNDQGIYIANLLNNYNCIVSDSLLLNVFNLPVFNIGEDTVLCAEHVFDLHLPQLPYSFAWQNGSTEEAFTPEGGAIVLTAIDSNLCVFSDTINVMLVDCSGQAANVITNNGDGVNEFFTVFNSEYSYDNCLVILNRWGNVVYEENYYRNTFNGYTIEGKKLDDGVYFFLYYQDCNRKKEITHQGFLQIISQ